MIEGVINSRPLTYIFDDTEGISCTFDIHKYSESKNNLVQIDQSTRTRKELETAHMKPLRAALGFHRFAERRKLFTCFSLCAIFDWPTASGRVAVSKLSALTKHSLNVPSIILDCCGSSVNGGSESISLA